MPSRNKIQDSIPCLNRNPTGLEVIIVSLPRTGTSSMKLALEQLGYPNVYHMSTFVENPEDYRYWRQAIEARISGHTIPRSVWDDLFGKYQLLLRDRTCQRYPNAKVVILNRDSEKWYDSFANTVQKIIKRRESLATLEWILRPCLPAQLSAIIRIGNLSSKSGIGLGSYDKNECLRFFHKYYADCRARIDPERCIEFKVQDGWSPLCEHLGVCVPGRSTADGWVPVPFPHVNDRDAFHITWVAGIQHSMLKQTWINLALYGLMLLGITVLFLQATWFIGLHWYA